MESAFQRNHRKIAKKRENDQSRIVEKRWMRMPERSIPIYGRPVQRLVVNDYIFGEKGACFAEAALAAAEFGGAAGEVVFICTVRLGI